MSLKIEEEVQSVTRNQGISVLIPCFQFDVRLLVSDLLRQLESLKIPFEIRVYDDFSKEEFKLINRSIAKSSNVEYVELVFNHGRSKIRNKLAEEAKYPWILFLDCDSALVDDTFIEHYLLYRNDFDVIAGGTIYSEKLPTKEVSLRWKYGRKREQISADTRNKNKYQSLTLNNLLLRRQLFLQIGLDESISTYGHEDSKLGFRLLEKGAVIHHIDNPVLHLGLEPNVEYIKKIEQAVQNFYYLSVVEGYGRETRLYQWYETLSNSFISGIIRKLLTLFRPLIINNLKSSSPVLILSDLLKLQIMLSVSISEKDTKHHAVK